MKFYSSIFILLLLIAVGCNQTKKNDDSYKSPVAEIDLSPEELAEGKVLFTKCAACHGHNAEGVRALNSPALANQETWYLRQQIKNFRNGNRGTHELDVYGAQMAPMAKILETEDQIETVIAYIKLLPRLKTDQTVYGDVKNGQSFYHKACASCHGTDAKGKKQLKSPNLLGIQDYYIELQLNNFREGIRGSAKNDLLGMGMRDVAQNIPDDQTVKDVVAYIHSLQSKVQ